MGYDLMRRSKKPGWWSPEIGVYDRTISFVVPSACLIGAPIEMCCPIGKPSIEVSEGSLNR